LKVALNAITITTTLDLNFPLIIIDIVRAARRVSGINVIRHAHNKKIEKPITLKAFARK
jgi:hypothetical protein